MYNPEIKNLKKEVLSKFWSEVLKVTIDYRRQDGSWETQVREVYSKQDGSVILLYNKVKRTVILTRQFRMPTYFNGNKTGMLIEACAGLLDNDNPEDCIRREAEEETGYRIPEVKKIYEAYMSPGCVTELVYFFIGEYTDDMKISEGGGHDHEHENIEVIELPFDEAFDMIGNGQIMDGKTIMLLQYARMHNLV